MRYYQLESDVVICGREGFRIIPAGSFYVVSDLGFSFSVLVEGDRAYVDRLMTMRACQPDLKKVEGQIDKNRIDQIIRDSILTSLARGEREREDILI